MARGQKSAGPGPSPSVPVLGAQWSGQGERTDGSGNSPCCFITEGGRVATARQGRGHATGGPCVQGAQGRAEVGVHGGAGAGCPSGHSLRCFSDRGGRSLWCQGQTSSAGLGDQSRWRWGHQRAPACKARLTLFLALPSLICFSVYHCCCCCVWAQAVALGDSSVHSPCSPPLRTISPFSASLLGEKFSFPR